MAELVGCAVGLAAGNAVALGDTAVFADGLVTDTAVALGEAGALADGLAAGVAVTLAGTVAEGLELPVAVADGAAALVDVGTGLSGNPLEAPTARGVVVTIADRVCSAAATCVATRVAIWLPGGRAVDVGVGVAVWAT